MISRNMWFVYFGGAIEDLIEFIEPYSLTGNFETLWKDKIYFRDGKLHREDGPAIDFIIGRKEWYINGKLHREDGPAIEYADGYKAWYINGFCFTEEKFNARKK